MKAFLCGVVVVLLMSACTTRPVLPSRASRRAIDTIYEAKIMVLQPHFDSVCAHLTDSLYAVAVDSIMNVRKTEMMELVQ